MRFDHSALQQCLSYWHWLPAIGLPWLLFGGGFAYMFVFRFLYVKEQHVKINLFEHAYYKAISSELTIKFGMVRETVSDSCISGESLCCCHGDHLCVKPIRKSKQYLSLYLQYSTLVKVCWCQNMNSILFACLIIHNNNTSPTQELFISLGAPTSLNFIHEFNYL